MKQIQVTDDTYNELVAQAKVVVPAPQSPTWSHEDMLGRAYFFRTVTYHILGRVESVNGDLLRLSEASWVADSGRFMQCVKEGKISELEPLGEWNVNLCAVTDFGPWNHPLPTEQK